ncbi:MAG TPA: hypothetical protein VEQ66_08440 [Propionibacteriaceae bacterium]|nr:hypothetical protein [Propionibacteriaceae bacterium]
MTLLDIDPNVVKPGWTPLIILIVMAVIVGLLYLSMRHEFSKINVAGDEPAGEPEVAVDEVAPAPPVARD